MFSKFKHIMLTALFSLGVISCTSCKSTAPSAPSATPTVVSAAPTAPTTVLIKKDKWQFTLPGSGWVAGAGAPEMSMMLVNKEKHNLIIMINEAYAGTLDDYTMVALTGARGSSANIISVRPVAINGVNCYVIEASKESVRLWTLVTVANGQGYGLSCGGPADDDDQHDICFSVMKSLQISK